MSRLKSRTPLKLILRVLPLFVFLFAGTSVLANKGGAAPQEAVATAQPEEKKESLNAGEMILHHIADMHEIHLFGDVAIYLPVILFAEDGLKVFSSSHLYHNPVSTTKTLSNGEVEQVKYYAYDDFVMYHEKIFAASPEGGLTFDPETGAVSNAAVLDFSITKSVLGVFITLILLLWLFGSVARGYKKRKGKAPKGIQSFMEPLILFIRDEVAVPSIGEKKADRFMPFLLSMFFFIWVANLLGLIPFIGGFNITGTISVTLVLAVLVFILITINGNKHYWAHILAPSGVPLPVKFILVPIEFASMFIKPAVLMVRLTANITAGHIILLAFVSLVLIFGETSAAAGYGVGVGSVLFLIFMFFLELLVVFLQAYVFTLLAAIYLGEATQEAHH